MAEAHREIKLGDVAVTSTAPIADAEALAALGARGLIPPRAPHLAPPRIHEDVDLADSFRGALIGTAVGDALGRPAEGRARETVRQRFGELREYQKWSGWMSGPAGTITDDTQMTMCVAKCIIASGGRVDPEDLARRFVDWLPEGRGKGAACVEAVTRLANGYAWHEAGVGSAGNGAAMRVAPIGLIHMDSVDAMRIDAALSAVVTHAHPVAVASAVAQARMVAYCAATLPGALSVEDLLADVGAMLADVNDPGSMERKPGSGERLVRLAERIAEVGDRLDDAPEVAFDYFYNGAFVLESLPAALWCFLRTPNDPEEVLVTAASGGRDADTVAAMAGALVGAYLGASALPKRWIDPANLEFAEELAELAEGLLEVETD